MDRTDIIRAVGGLAGNAFTYWMDGSTRRFAAPYSPRPGTGYPYLVEIAEWREEWCPHRKTQVTRRVIIPGTALLWARGPNHAAFRVLAALEECRAGDYHGTSGCYDKHGQEWGVNRANELIVGLESGRYRLRIAPADETQIVRPDWADKGIC